MHTSSRLLVALVIVLKAAIGEAFGQSGKVENALFWEISGKEITKPSYLFGTYHVLNDAYLEEIPAVKNAFANADGVVVETVLDSAKMQQVMMSMMLSGKKLTALISAEDFALVSAEVEKALNSKADLFVQFKPMFVTFMLTLAYNYEENKEFLEKYTGLPLDLYFASAAKKKGRPVTSLESMEEQFNILFKHDTEEEQAEQLVEFVKTKEEMKIAMKELTSLYVTADLQGMFDIYKKYARQFGEASYLLDERNIKWMKQLPAILKEGNRFIAVGALHFTGEKGLIKLLRESGYTVKPLPLK